MRHSSYIVQLAKRHVFLLCLCWKLYLKQNLLYLDLSIGFLYTGQSPQVSRYLHAKQRILVHKTVVPTRKEKVMTKQSQILPYRSSNTIIENSTRLQTTATSIVNSITMPKKMTYLLQTSDKILPRRSKCLSLSVFFFCGEVSELSSEEESLTVGGAHTSEDTVGAVGSVGKGVTSGDTEEGTSIDGDCTSSNLRRNKNAGVQLVTVFFTRGTK